MANKALAEIRKGIKEADIPKILERAKIEREKYIAHRNRFRRSVCGICARENIDEINEAILRCVPFDQVEKQFSITENTMKRHWEYHLRPQIFTPFAPTDGPALSARIATMVKKRSMAAIPINDHKKILQFALLDLWLARRLCMGNISDDGLVVVGPNVAGIVSTAKSIVLVSEKLKALEESGYKSPSKRKRETEVQSDIPAELVPAEQQTLIDQALEKNQEAINAATNGRIGGDEEDDFTHPARRRSPEDS